MEFPGFLGNDQLKASLSAAVDRQRAAHFYLLSGPSGAGKRTLARLLAAALLCRDPHRRPCGRCGPCRKVLAGTHPDFITVDDPDRKTVSVETVRRAREDLFIRPNEGDRKIYYVPRAQDLGLPGQNALLKVLEEPPPMACFCSWQTIRIGCCLRFVPAAWSCGSSRCRSPFWWRHWRKTSLKLAVRRWPLRPGAAEAGWGRPGSCCRKAPGYPRQRDSHKPSVGGTTSACFRSWPPWRS